MKCEGKKALVFGGTSGIGLATARELRKLGATVIAISRNPEKAAETDGLTLEACDVLDRSALTKLFEKHAPFDILITAATGGDRALGPFLQMDLDAYQASFAKLWGYTNVVRLGTEHLSESGCIVLVSGAPARRAKPGQIALASVGASVEQFVRVVAPELAPRRINVVSPGIIDTPMFGPEGCEEKKRKLSAMTGSNVIPRAGTSEEVAKAILYLVDNDFATGTTVDVDGGWLCKV
eukprot:TRINITY_DN63251_c0_g1_i1.p1 TRINITY_DN63251_c0_g1~~TRINITY_DN63251_c0_g1_i1.p1  ORF type:complete len:236 (-),score=44.98 TRINITY_DN63251_c0_g1_i1:115-822(-)